jgi:hypothetical protein
MSATLLPVDARTTPPTHPRWGLAGGISRTAPTAWGQPSAGRQFQRGDAAADSTDVDSDELRCAAHDGERDEAAQWVGDDGDDDSGEMRCAALPTADVWCAARAARIISHVHAQLALVYAYAHTFQRAVRDFIPADTLDILPCLSVGVLDALDTQLPRLDALLDDLTRAAAGVPAARAFPGKPLRYSRRERAVDDPRPVFGIVQPPAPDPEVDPSRAEMPRRSL